MEHSKAYVRPFEHNQQRKKESDEESFIHKAPPAISQHQLVTSLVNLHEISTSMASPPPNPIETYGFTPLPLSPSLILQGRKNNTPPTPLTVSSLPPPSTPLALSVQEYAREHLSPQTFSHSMRAYYYGLAIKSQQFPDWKVSDETYFLTCMLHDIGTTHENLRKTLMSFEFYGGLLALELLEKEMGAPREQAEGVAEVCIYV